MKLFSKISLSLLCAIGVLVVCACSGNNEVRETLQRAESMMEDHPDTSLQIIKDIDTLLLKSRKDIALYSLLRTQAEDKNYKDTTDTRIITKAVDYYAGSNDEYHKMLSYYYRARIEQNAEDYSKAIVDLMKAETAGLKLEDWFQLGLIYRAFSDIYNSVYSNVESLKYAKKSYACFVKSGREYYANWALAYMWRSFNNGGDYETALEYSNRIIDVAGADKDTALLVNGLRYSGISNLGGKHYREAVNTYIGLMREFPDFLEVSDYRNLGIAYVGIDQIDSAVVYKNYVELHDSTDNWLSYEVNKALGNLEGALYAMEKEHEYQHNILMKVIEAKVTDAVLAFSESEKEQQHKQLVYEKRSKIIFIITLFVIIILLSIILWQRHLAHKKDILAKMAMLSQLQSSLNDTKLLNSNLQSVVSDTKMQNENLRAAIGELYGRSLKTLDELCDKYYSGSEDKAIVQQVKELIKVFSDDEKTVGQLEFFVNKYKNNIVQKFRSEFPDFRDADYKLFLYLAAGLSMRAICIFVNTELGPLYSRKKRLKQKVNKESSKFKAEFLSVIG